MFKLRQTGNSQFTNSLYLLNLKSQCMNRLLTLILIIIFGYAGNTNNQDSVVSATRSILVDNQPYLIKGICYNPVPKGSDHRSWESLSQDLKLMKEAGINTVRLYSPVDKIDVLDAFRNAGIKVIIGFGYNQGGYYDILSGSFIDYIDKYKDHDAILFWELGNEYNYHPEWFDGDINNWYKALNDAAKLIHERDNSHMVATAHGEIPDKDILKACPDIDIWGMNVYRWDNPENIFKEWKALSDKPMYLAEAGADSYMKISKSGYSQGVNEQAQADAVKNILAKTFENSDICSGVTIFAFNDELWKAGNNDQYDPGGWAPNSTGVPYDGAPNEEYWGIVDIDRNRKKAFYIVKEAFNE